MFKKSNVTPSDVIELALTSPFSVTSTASAAADSRDGAMQRIALTLTTVARTSIRKLLLPAPPIVQCALCSTNPLPSTVTSVPPAIGPPRGTSELTRTRVWSNA